MSLFQSGTIYLQKTNFDELFFKLYLIHEINQFFSIDDKSFLLSFESGNPDWTLGYETFKDYPSVQWKLFNIEKLRKSNPRKFDMEIERLRLVLGQ